MQQAQLESLPATLAGTFPAAEDAPLARALLGLLASGSPMTPAELAEATRRPIGRLPEPAHERSLARGRPRLPSRVTPLASRCCGVRLVGVVCSARWASVWLGAEASTQTRRPRATSTMRWPSGAVASQSLRRSTARPASLRAH